ncbi:DUF6518 family protein [Jiangella alba]|uniref:Uncharacterized protein n=1 Tax=Jiangella alba TaxID=561176 RepID=A0A1H5PSX5_9ACTN|nr:DUF6518 family protein [Jiangella alba]SEF16744.1 hypothetical protein SAMN04488561_5516 [Jiangella alba]
MFAPAPRRPLVVLSAVAAAGLALGVLTAYAQGWLPDEVGSLANSSGAWTVLAFGLAWWAAGRPVVAAAAGALALLTLLAGYVIGAEVRGFPSSTALMVFWGAAAIVVGPVIGLAAAWVRSGPPVRAALGAGAVAGVLAGEGVYGLRYVADTTYPPYWWGSIVAGVLLLAAVIAGRRLPARAAALAVVVTAVVAAAFVVLYSADLISVLP